MNDTDVWEVVVDAMCVQAHATATVHGFYDDIAMCCSETDQLAHLTQRLCLIHSEVSEAMEVLRRNADGESSREFLMELADVVIRVLDLAEYVETLDGPSFGEVLVQKMEHNASRPPKHGKLF